MSAADEDDKFFSKFSCIGSAQMYHGADWAFLTRSDFRVLFAARLNSLYPRFLSQRAFELRWFHTHLSRVLRESATSYLGAPFDGVEVTVLNL